MTILIHQHFTKTEQLLSHTGHSFPISVFAIQQT